MVSRQFRVLETVGSSPAASTKLSSVLLGSIFFACPVHETGNQFWAKNPTAAGGGSREGDFGAAVEILRSDKRV